MLYNNGTLRRLLIFAVALFLLASTPAALASGPPDNSVIAHAVQLNDPAHASLMGHTGGAFAYYRFNYPGDNSSITITLNSIPGDNMTYADAGFNVIYGDKIVGRGQIEPTYGVLDLTYQSLFRGTYYIQVFNYLNNVDLQYALRVNGLPCRPASEPIVPPGTIPPVATNTNGSQPKPLVGSDSGLFVNDTILTQGSTDGVHLYYSIDYPGLYQSFFISFGFTPADQSTQAGLGMNISLNGTPIGGAAPLGPGLFQYILSTGTPGIYTIDLFNFLPGTTANYNISVVGAACNQPVSPQPIAAPSPQPSPAAPLALITNVPEGSNSVGSAAVGLAPGGSNSTLTGKAAGAYGYYVFTYPGDNSTVQLKLSYAPVDAPSNAVGFLVINSAGQVAASSPGPAGTATASFASGIAGGYYVQVYNYAPGTRIQYTLSKT